MLTSIAHSHLRALIAVSISTLLHFAIIWWLSTHSRPEPAKYRHMQSSALQVNLLSAHIGINKLTTMMPEAESLFAQSMQKNSAEVLASLPQTSAGNVDGNVDGNVPISQYYATKDTDRKALPVGNIDTAMLQGEVIDNFPLQFRIYIDEKGKVKRIEQLAVLEQDRALANKLERLLYELSFIPAKKSGIDVSSYQDVEFSFQATMNETSAPASATPTSAYSSGGSSK
jgi:hypothetical protein